MKTLFHFIFLFPGFLICTSVLAQCPPGDVSLTSQLEVDNFAVNWPNCTAIDGSLTIYCQNANDLIDDLTPLGNLITVEDNLRIITQHTYQNPLMLDGFENITSVGSLSLGLPPVGSQPELWISSLTPLNGISGDLESLEWTNVKIDDMGSFDNISAIDIISFKSCPSITELPGFPNLTYVRDMTVQATGLQTLEIPQSIITFSTVDGEPPLVSQFSGLFVFANDQLETIICESSFDQMFDIYISDNPSLSQISGFDSLIEVDYVFDLSGNNPEIFNSFHQLEKARKIELELLNPAPGVPMGDWNITIGQNAAELFLTADIPVFAQEGLVIKSNDATALHFHANLTDIQGVFSLTGPLMTEVTGFENLDAVSWDFNLDLVSINPLPDFTALTYIGRNLNIEWEMASFEDFSGLENLEHIDGQCTIGSNFYSINNTAFQSLDGLENLHTVGNNLIIRSLPNLSDISAITNISSVTGLLDIQTLPALLSNDIVFQNVQSLYGLILRDLEMQTLPSFPQLTEVSAAISIGLVPNISEITGFPNLLSASVIRIEDNSNLTQIFCNPDLEVPLLFSLDGNSSLNECTSPCICRIVETAEINEIADNGPSCGDQDDILSDCLLGAGRSDAHADLRIWIDVNGNLNLQSNQIRLNGMLDIYDVAGRRLLEENLVGNEVDFQTAFPRVAPGIYLVNFNSGTERYSQKVFWNE